MASNYATDVLTLPAQQPALIAFWQFTDAAGAATYADSSAGGNSLTKVGGITSGSTALVTGSADTSCLFNGLTGYAQTAASVAALNFARTAPFTVECIVKLTSTVGEQIIVGNIDAATLFTGWEVSITGGQLQFILSSAYPTSVIQVVSTSAVISAGTVYHVVFEYDGSSSASGVSLYVNGNFAAATVLQNTLSTATTTTQKITVGARASSAPSSALNGNLQELAIYDGQFFFQHQLGQGVVPRHYGLMLGRLPLANDARAVITGGGVPNVLLNANMVYDCDDAGECNWAATMDKNGEINLLANITGETEPYASTASNIVLNLYFNAAVPIGPSQRTDFSTLPGTTFNGPPGVDGGKSLQARFAPTDTGRGNSALYPLNDVATARAALNAVANGTAIIISNSPLESLNDFLNSISNYGGDGILKTGVQIMNQKVARMYYLGGNWPNSGPAFIDFNFLATTTSPNKVSSQAAHDFFATMAASCAAVEIVIVGPEIIYGPSQNQANVVTGPPNVAPPPSGDPLVNPVKYAYDLFGFPTGRGSFASVLNICAVRGIAPFFEVGGLRGAVVIDANTGENSFDGATNNNVSYVRPLYTNAQFVAIANEIYFNAPNGLVKPAVPRPDGLGGRRTNAIG